MKRLWNTSLFSSLRWRLMLTYTAIVLLTLAVIAVALYLFLETRQASANPVRPQYEERLYNFYETQIADDATLRIGENGPTLRQGRMLNRIATSTLIFRRQEIRLLVVDGDQRIALDTFAANRLEPGTPAALSNIQPLTVKADTANAEPSPTDLVRGDLRAPDGTLWLFVGQPLQTGQFAILVAVRMPRQTQVISAILEDYGDLLIAPMVQAALIGVAVALLLSILITRWVARPLQKVAETAAAVAQGDLDRRAPVQGPYEVRTVAESFNRMSAEVQAAQQAQRDFLANVTHDLRTPLTSIQGFSQAIADGVAADPAAAQRAAQIINDEAGRLNRMVQDLLDLARVEAGRFNMTRHTLRLHDLLRGVGERLTPKAAEKALTLVVEVPALPAIAGDGDRLVQVFTNLIDNGIKHTPAGGTITLQATTKPGWVAVRVRDTGEGIPAEDVPHIFDRFYQVDKSRPRRDGAGLGLTICKQIVEAHAGKINVESVEGLGTAFTVWLPTPAPDANSSSALKRRPSNPSLPVAGAADEMRTSK
jgi:signal transduction histidine kinase